MEIIPVIDIRHGLAVRAVAGDRANYRPLETPLAPGTSDPVEVTRRYLALYPFKTLYVADLDGIEGRGTDTALIGQIAEAWSGETWLDAGDPHFALNADGCLGPGLRRDDGLGGSRAGAVDPVRWRAVLGSESIRQQSPLSVKQLLSLEARPVVSQRRHPGEGRAPGKSHDRRIEHVSRQRGVLSLDFRGDAFIGPPELLASPDMWPDDVIVMTLGRVGLGQGPDLARVRRIVDAAGPQRRVFAAGGVRHRDDVAALIDAGAAGALVATALHSGKIKAGDLEEIAGW